MSRKKIDLLQKGAIIQLIDKKILMRRKRVDNIIQ